MDLDRPRTPEFSDIPIRYLYVKVDRLREIRERIELGGTQWRVIEVNYGDSQEFYNSNGTIARLTVTPMEEPTMRVFVDNEEVGITPQDAVADWLLTAGVSPDKLDPESFGPTKRLEDVRKQMIHAEVEAMDWPDTIGE